MATRADGAGDILTRTANLPSISNFTMAGWGYRNADDGNPDYRYFAGLESATSNAPKYLVLGWGTGTLQLTANFGSANFSSSPAVGNWFYWFMAAQSGSPVTYRAGWKISAWNTVSFTATPDYTPALMSLLSDSWGEWVAMSVERFRVWDAYLTTGDLDSEMVSAAPVRTANLRQNNPLTAHTDLSDTVNGYNFTAGGSLVTFTPGPSFSSPDIIPALLRPRRIFVIDSWR